MRTFFGKLLGKKIWMIALAAVAIGSHTPAVAQDDKEGNLFMDILSCKNTSDKAIYSLINQLGQMLPKGYGTIANDSIKTFLEKSKQLQAQNKYIVQAKTIPYKADTTSYKTWLKTVFKGAKTASDSIELLCKWIPANFAVGETEINFVDLAPDSFYYKIRDGRIYAEAGGFCEFLCKVAKENNSNWKWGVPLKVSSEPDASLKGVGKQPHHTWVGFANDSGKIWCVADPSIGGIVKDKWTNMTLSLDSIKVWLRSKEKSEKVYINTAKTSLQAIGPCVFAQQLRNANNVEAYTPKGTKQVITRGEWFTFCEEGSMRASLVAPYWRALEFPRSSVCNTYCQYTSAKMFGSDALLLKKITENYGLVEE